MIREQWSVIQSLLYVFFESDILIKLEKSPKDLYSLTRGLLIIIHTYVKKNTKKSAFSNKGHSCWTIKIPCNC